MTNKRSNTGKETELRAPIINVILESTTPYIRNDIT